MHYLLWCVFVIALATAQECPRPEAPIGFERCLRPKLSPEATLIAGNSSILAPRWTEYHEFNTRHVVNVSTEADVQAAVRCANEAGIQFFAQSGGNAWSTTWSLGGNDVVINLRNMNEITFNATRTLVEIGGGTIVSELMDAGYKNDAQIVVPNCNCVGVLGATLGAGYSRFMGQHGFAIDNLLSFRTVLASGEIVNVSPSSHPELWWAMRGAGGNFGIVVSAVFKAYPTPKAHNGAWLGNLVFSEDKIERVVAAVNDLTLTSKMAIFFYFANSGAPDYEPIFMVTPFYLSGVNTSAATAEARQAFASVFDIGPETDSTAWTPLNQVNAGSDTFCIPGSRKVSYGAGEAQLDPATWRAIYTDYSQFIASNGGDNVGDSLVLMEAYSLGVAEAKGDESSAYAWRSSNRFNTVAIGWYTNSDLDATANSWASGVREKWRSTSGLKDNSTYINFAFGDETLQEIYGPNVLALRALKARYDPENRFNQFFPLN